LWADEPGALAVAAAWWMKRPAIVSVMGGELVRLAEFSYGSQRSLAGRTLVRFALRHATSVTAGSSTLARSIPRTSAWELKIVPLGVDAARFRPATASGLTLAGRFRILHVASLSPVKDQATLIAAMGQVTSAEDAHLHVVGDGPLRAQLAAQVAASGLERHVTFHGAISHDRLPAFYQAADVCVVSSRHESQSMAAIEACGCGRPVIGTAVGIIPDLEDAVRVVAPGDTTALARAILELARDHAMRLAMGRQARLVVERALTVDHTVEAWLGLYEEVVRARSQHDTRTALKNS
jgi:glycosyltransferase involved in cell wall biosynthesis